MAHVGVDATSAAAATGGILEGIINGTRTFLEKSNVVDFTKSVAGGLAAVLGTYVLPTTGLFDPSIVADPKVIGSSFLMGSGIGAVAYSEGKGNLLGILLTTIGGSYLLPRMANALNPAYDPAGVGYGLLHVVGNATTALYNVGHAAYAAVGLGGLIVAGLTLHYGYKFAKGLYVDYFKKEKPSTPAGGQHHAPAH